MKIFAARSTKAVLLCLLAAPAGVMAETLKDIYQQALQNDHQFKAAQANLAAGKENPTLGRAQLLPQVSADGTWANNDTDITNKIRTDRSGNQDSQSTQLELKLRQPLFNMAIWHNYKRSQTLGNLAESQFKQAEQDLIIRTAKAYFEALKSVDNYNTAKAEDAALSRQLDQTKQRFAVGLIAMTEVHEAQAAYDAAHANLLTAQGQVGIAAEALEVLTGKGYTGLSPLKLQFPVLPPAPEGRQDWVDFALNNNARLQSAGLQAEAAQLNAKAKKAEHLPTLTGSLGLSQEDNRTDSTLPPDPGSTRSSTDGNRIAISVHIPLYSGGATSASRRQAKQEQYASEELKQQTERDVVQATRSLHLSVTTGVAAVKARKQSIVSSQSALEAVRAGYEVGTRDLVELLNAQQRVFLAERNYHEALYTYVLNSLELKQAAGLLQAQDIQALDNWLDTGKTVPFSL